jgi:membrane protein implicated in regulation of membrane protease activity
MVVGLVLVIVELVTGTFYLLMLGVAAFGAAAAAYLGAGFPVQSIVAGVVAAAGCYGVHLYRARNRGAQMAPVDQGQPASFESWLDRAAGLARVRYRGASWDARIEDGGAAELQSGAMLYVTATEGSTLRVSLRRAG